MYTSHPHTPLTPTSLHCALVSYFAKHAIKNEREVDYCHHYQDLSVFLKEFEKKNPNSKTTLVTDKEGVYQYSTLTFGANAEVVRRAGLPTFSLDGAHMTKHHLFIGTMLALVGRDSEGDMVELAFMLIASKDGGSSRGGESEATYVASEASSPPPSSPPPSSPLPSSLTMFCARFARCRYGAFANHVKAAGMGTSWDLSVRTPVAVNFLNES